MQAAIRSTVLAGLLCAVTSVAANAQAPRSQEAEMENAQRIADLVIAYKILLNEGVLDSFGHVSVRSATDPNRFLMPYALPPSLVSAEDVIEYGTSDSQPIDPRGRKVNGERYIHGEIYKVRPEVVAVVHNHSPSVIPFSVTGVPMRPIYHMASFIGDGMPNFEIRKVQKGTDLLVKTPKLGAGKNTSTRT